MDRKLYINKIAFILDNSQKTMEELLDGALVATLSEWTLADLSLCKEPAITKEIEGRIVMYNKAKRIIYIEDIASCVLNDVCGVINEIKWNT